LSTLRTDRHGLRHDDRNGSAFEQHGLIVPLANGRKRRLVEQRDAAEYLRIGDRADIQRDSAVMR
jgi:hypothetical protein